jgi:hypothetical protein
MRTIVVADGKAAGHAFRSVLRTGRRLRLLNRASLSQRSVV